MSDDTKQPDAPDETPDEVSNGRDEAAPEEGPGQTVPSDSPAPEAAAKEAADEAAAAKAKAEAKAKALAAAKAKKEAEEAAKPPWERDPAAPAVEDAAGHELVAALVEQDTEAVLEARRRGDELEIDVRRDRIRAVCERLKEDGFGLLVDICGADYPKREDERFEVVYHLYSVGKNRRVRLKVRVGEGDEVPTVTPVWRGADWCEREIYDMYGVRFDEHPDMTRILLWEGFKGFPLRKDFPIEGIDTGAAIYPEYYEEEAGPVAGTGTGWKPPEPPAPEEAAGGGETAPDEAPGEST